MTVSQIAQYQQQSRINQLAQSKTSTKHVNPYGTPGMSLNDTDDYRKMVPVDESVVKQVKDMAMAHMKQGFGTSDGQDISSAIKSYVMTLAPEKRLSASWTLNEIFHSEVTRLGEYVHQADPSWTWGKPFDTSILDGYTSGVDFKA